jgi:mannose/cellobiose epimerase-like protein (N-acyl-D-glucosamine 2-epimerase family)
MDRIRADADAMLRNVVLPFWAHHGWDEVQGGFLLELARGGTPLGDATKFLVPQARMIWSFAAAHRCGFGDGRYLDLACRGARFLVDRLWDVQAGGFMWAVARDGRPRHDDKRTYGQAFAIYALAECALASGESWVRDWAVRSMDVLVRHARDGEHGFVERFDARWNPLGPNGQGKTVNVHLHIIEALTPLVQLTRDAAHEQCLRQLLTLVLRRGVDQHEHFAINDRLTRDWDWRPLWRRPIGVSYGHAAELAWLARLALDVRGDSPEPLRTRVLGMIDHALRYGFDPVRGGVATLGPPVGRARNAWYLPRWWRATRWWEQAELLVGVLMAYQWTKESSYVAAFVLQFEHVRVPAIRSDQFDPAEWGSHDWKDPYHGVRALLEVTRRLPAPAQRT